jgi:hypothetical protein
MSLTPEDRRKHGRIGALVMHSLNDTLVVSAPGRLAARAKLDERLLADVDPDGSLPGAERARRLGYARKAYFSQLALRSAKARRRSAA